MQEFRRPVKGGINASSRNLFTRKHIMRFFGARR